MPLTQEELYAKSVPELLDLALEEAAELIQAIVKMKRHGEQAIGPTGIHYDNLRNVALEFDQVEKLCTMLCQRHGQDIYGLIDAPRPIFRGM